MVDFGFLKRKDVVKQPVQSTTPIMSTAAGPMPGFIKGAQSLQSNMSKIGSPIPGVSNATGIAGISSPTINPIVKTPEFKKGLAFEKRTGVIPSAVDEISKSPLTEREIKNAKQAKEAGFSKQEVMEAIARSRKRVKLEQEDKDSRVLEYLEPTVKAKKIENPLDAPEAVGRMIINLPSAAYNAGAFLINTIANPKKFRDDIRKMPEAFKTIINQTKQEVAGMNKLEQIMHIGDKITDFVQENPDIVFAPESLAALKGSSKIMRNAIKSAKGVDNVVLKSLDDVIEATSKIQKVDDIKPISKAGQAELFKAQNTSVGKLTKRADLKNVQNKSARANEIIVEKGYDLPIDTQTRVDTHQQAMRDVWNDVKAVQKDGEKLEIDLTQGADEIRKYLDENPALATTHPTEYAALEGIIEKYKQLGSKDIIFAENLKQLLNAEINNRGQSRVSDVLNNAYKKVTSNIGKQMDKALSSIPGEFQKLKNDFGALADGYEDVVKANIVALRKKGVGLTETYSRLEGFGDIIGALGSTIAGNNPISGLAQGAAKLIIGKQLAKLKDVDYLIKRGFEKLSKELGAKKAGGLSPNELIDAIRASK